MILSWKRNTRSLENIKYNRPSARRGLETRLFQDVFFSKSSRATLPQIFRMWKVAEQKKKKILKAEFLLTKKMSKFGRSENYYLQIFIFFCTCHFILFVFLRPVSFVRLSKLFLPRSPCVVFANQCLQYFQGSQFQPLMKFSSIQRAHKFIMSRELLCDGERLRELLFDRERLRADWELVCSIWRHLSYARGFNEVFATYFLHCFASGKVRKTNLIIEQR